MLAVLKLITFLLGHIPPGLSILLAKMLGKLAYRLDKTRSVIARDNLRRALGSELTEDEIDAIAQRVFEHISMTFMEFMRQPWLKKSDLEGYVKCVGIENLEKALSKKKGAIICTAHFGNWELLGAFMGLKGFPMDIVVRDPDHPLFDKFVRWVRMRSGNSVITKKMAMRPLLKNLSRNAIAGILLDQNVTRTEGVFVDFFGRQACTNKGPALLAASSGAAVLPTFILRTGDRTHTVFIGERIDLVDSGDKANDVIANTALFTKAIEEMVRAHPEQWFWVHRRWKTRPQISE
jgi:KDO2-lipid IV(A) lauroyltransferase